VLAVVVSTFFVGFGGGVVFPILPNLGAILGISPALVGLILSANRFTRIVANGPAGSLVDRVGTRTPLIVGLFVEAVATLGYVVALGSGVPEAWFLGARVVRGGITLGFPAGLVLGGVVSDLYTVSTAFVLAAGFALVASLVAYVAVPETHVSGSHTAVKPWELDTTATTLSVGFVNFGLFFAYLGALFATLVLFVDANDIAVWGYGPQGMSGLLMAVTVLSASGFMLAGGKASDVHGARIPTLFVFLGVSLVGFLALAATESLWPLVAACVCIGAGQGGASGPLMALLADLTPDGRTGRAMGTNNVLGDFGGALGPVVTLPLVETVGFAPIYAACAVIPLFAGAVLLSSRYVRTGSVRPRTERSGGD